MKKIISACMLSLFLSSLFAQELNNLDYCKCVDKVGQVSPALNGTFERNCNGKLIEKGSFQNGSKNGDWTSYSKKGTLIRRINYSNGLLDGKSEFFFSNGKPKLSANFEKGQKTGTWTYYSSNGKTLMEGAYLAGKPTGTWTINDKKGKPVTQYDFTNNKSLVNNPAQFHKDGDIIQNDNTAEWYILKYPDRSTNVSTAPLGGFNFAGDLFVELMEIPLDFWDTYISYKYKATFSVTTENVSTFNVTTISNHMPDGTPIFPFLVLTNPEDKIKHVEHTQLSDKLLEFKINEALNFMPPWIYNNSATVEVYVPYVINQIVKF